MHIAKDDIPVRMEVPGSAVARQAIGFGNASGYGAMSGEYFSLAAGTDIRPLLAGLEGDLCQVPHWGYLASGALTVSYADGSEEAVAAGELFYWPPGHTVRVEQDAEFVMFSPQTEHAAVLDHMKDRLDQEAAG